MKDWFEAKVTYEKTLENGKNKKVSESFLLDALSWTEAEQRICEHMKDYIDVDYTIADIKRVKLSEVFDSDDGEKFFKAKIQFISLDEKNGTEKKISAYMLARANDIDQAQALIKLKMEDTMSDYVIAEVKETKIVEVYAFAENFDVCAFADKLIPNEQTELI